MKRDDVRGRRITRQAHRLGLWRVVHILYHMLLSGDSARLINRWKADTLDQSVSQPVSQTVRRAVSQSAAIAWTPHQRIRRSGSVDEDTVDPVCGSAAFDAGWRLLETHVG